MKALKVVDASALIAVLFSEPGADVISARLQDANLVAPTVLQFEVANACLMKLRRGATSKSVFPRIYAVRDSVKITSLPVVSQFEI